MPLASLASAPRVLALPVTTGTGARTSTGTCDAVVRLRNEPFAPGQSVLASSAGAGAAYGVPAPWGDATRHLKFKIAGSNITAAASIVGQVTTTAGRATAGKVVADLTVSLGIITTGQLAIGTIPTADTAIAYDDMLGAILLVNGVPYTRILDASSPAPAAKEWCADSDDATVLVIGADSTDYLPVGAEVDLLFPDSTKIGLLAKPNAVAGAALVANIPEERRLGVGLATTDTAGRSVRHLMNADFLAAAVAKVTLVGLTK
jgi:hypothetical protein